MSQAVRDGERGRSEYGGPPAPLPRVRNRRFARLQIRTGMLARGIVGSPRGAGVGDHVVDRNHRANSSSTPPRLTARAMRATARTGARIAIAIAPPRQRFIQTEGMPMAEAASEVN